VLRALQALRAALTIACLLLMHFAILRGAPALAVACGLVFAGANLAIAVRSGGRPLGRNPWLIPVVALSGAQIAMWFGYTSAVAVVLAPSAIVNIFLMILFGHTLLPGREPLITRFRRLDVGHVAPMFVPYTRRLTVLWTLLFAAATVASIGAAVWGSIALLSWIAFIFVPAASLSFFLGEHVYRAFRFGPEGRASPLRTVRIMLHPEAWPGRTEPAGSRQ